MDMTGKNKIEVENELGEWMANRGYWPMRCAMQSVEGQPQADMVFLKRGNIVVVKVVHLKAGNSKKTVSEYGQDLELIKEKATNWSLSRESNVLTGFVIKKGIKSEWYWEDSDATHILYKEDHNTLEEVIP